MTNREGAHRYAFIIENEQIVDESACRKGFGKTHPHDSSSGFALTLPDALQRSICSEDSQR